METANVDIRKLQLLNDRINQTIDALNQVRLSVHGLQHSAMPVSQNIGWGYPGTLPTSQIPVQGMTSPLGYGIAHTGSTDPRLLDPRLFGMIQDPRLQDPRFLGRVPVVGGLGHSTETVDPFWRERLFQTFPYATVPYPVVF
jgi:hypothetical protein